MARKTKLAGLMDTSSWGALLATTEMGITKKSEQLIRKMMRKSSFFRLTKGEAMHGSCEWQLFDTKEKFLAKYEFNVVGSKTFLNVSCNPTTLMAGINDIPVIVKGFRGNAVFSTFMLANRLGYALLEYVPSDCPFVWTGEDRRKYEAGDIILKQMQFAWYSADLGTERDEALHYVRSCYTGNNAIEGIHENLTKSLNIKANSFDDSANVSLMANAGRNTEFLLTLYAKDNQPAYREVGENVKRLQKLIRFDCTFYNYFLQKNKLATIHDLEEKYKDLCEADGYDIGFYRWLSNYISDRLHLSYILPLTNLDYLERLKNLSSIEFPQNEQILVDWWLSNKEVLAYSEMPEDFKKKASKGMEKNYKSYIDKVFAATKINLFISKDFHDAVLDNRKNGQRTRDERFEGLKAESNRKAIDKELLKRDRLQVKKMAGESGIIIDSTGILRLRRLVARSITYRKLHVFGALGLSAERIGEINNNVMELLQRK